MSKQKTSNLMVKILSKILIIIIALFIMKSRTPVTLVMG